MNRVAVFAGMGDMMVQDFPLTTGYLIALHLNGLSASIQG